VAEFNKGIFATGGLFARIEELFEGVKHG